MPVVIPGTAFAFLKQLSANNNRDWFNANKDKFLQEQSHIERFADALLYEMNKHDVLEEESGKKTMFRIYRDTRFSKDKTPYKNHWSGGFTRATAQRRGGYYWHLQPGGGSFVGGGFWGPNNEDLLRIRQELSADPAPLRKVLKGKTFVSHFGSLQGEQLKTAPKGFSADDPAIDLLRFKQFIVTRKFTDKEVMAPTFLKEVNATFKAMRPFLDVMTEILTTDANGNPLL
jgi:uncharacterized protein (TIGR02453 family)